MTTYTITHTVHYPGGHARDPGYRSNNAFDSSGNSYVFYSDPDGTNVRRISMRGCYGGEQYRALSTKNAARRYEPLERAIKAYLAGDHFAQQG